MLRRGFISVLLAALCFIPSAVRGEGEWPISKLRLIRTQWSSWITRFFALDDNNRLMYGRIIDQASSLQPITQFRRNPDLIKHFPMEDGDLIEPAVVRAARL